MYIYIYMYIYICIKPFNHQPSLPSRLRIQEIYYYCGQAKTVDHTNITGESVELSATTNVNSETLAQLTSEQGPLHCGVLPGTDCTSAEGEKALWSAIGNNPVSKIKKEKPEKEAAEEVTPKTPKENCPQLFSNTGVQHSVPQQSVAPKCPASQNTSLSFLNFGVYMHAASNKRSYVFSNRKQSRFSSDDSYLIPM